MKALKELLTGVDAVKVCGNLDVQVGKVHFDSRKVEKGDLFVAQRGVHADGHAFIEKAISLGASVVVCEELPEQLDERVTYVVVADSSFALGILASNYY
ncbi:MAG: UDP-N-acetylmuramoyl-L-alanyl-D-glutamate--2,6-diaminopimelate ligase, partial [Odoribacter sp.]|nr:UDP-N-acetylmuramoyl-L-alanyl-D-glutamate--2,6-diaminopimelate ligase [Odoribacter sp.]